MAPLKLLCLHGYTQSGPLFHAKSRAVIKHLTKALLPTHAVTTIYPTGPIHLLPSDIPGYEPPSSSTTSEETTNTDSYGWFRRHSTTNPPLYTDLHLGLQTIAQTILTEGPFDGVIGFSQGAAMAAIVASLLEPAREDAVTRFLDASVACAGTEFEGVEGFEVPGVWWEEVRKVQPELKFAVCYSGFRAPGPRYRGFYEPGVRTPVLHVLGSLDAVVEEGRSRALIEACKEEVGEGEKEKGRVVVHPGGHFVPAQRPYLDAVVGFVRDVLEGEKKKEVVEEDVNDMDLPF
ncbi:FSH1-domain-containing protein [Aspergillus sclerotiicarbonarius CBS 121057]|uniref:FSH1-domain-containing protein n=1 Tax=Aspergillus sclerotiicarbonarius (strain CBS 121057 / IBT 28362) TaxID=1448318 RepID=A0A319EXV8_ASPSB|nr:FSH1-domain-containing protein [Aspergillus sclerotiicarbonarius CBS 121057]